MSQEKIHIIEFRLIAKILICLLALTFITVSVTGFDLKTWNVTLALVVAITYVDYLYR